MCRRNLFRCCFVAGCLLSLSVVVVLFYCCCLFWGEVFAVDSSSAAADERLPFVVQSFVVTAFDINFSCLHLVLSGASTVGSYFFFNDNCSPLLLIIA